MKKRTDNVDIFAVRIIKSTDELPTIVATPSKRIDFKNRVAASASQDSGRLNWLRNDPIEFAKERSNWTDDIHEYHRVNETATVAVRVE